MGAERCGWRRSSGSSSLSSGTMDRPAVKRMEVDRDDGNGPTYPYLLGATLGEGSYGLVREGLDVSTGKVVAIKSLDRRLLKKQRRGLENLEREIRVHTRLGQHDTIVDLEDVIDIKSKSRIHLVLEYMHCGSVQDVLDRAPDSRLGQAQARRYFAGLLAGLQVSLSLSLSLSHTHTHYLYSV